MPSNNSKNSRQRSRSPQLRKALERMKWETAYEVGTPTGLIEGDYWGNVSSRDCGNLGGQMVRKMIEAAQASLVASTSAGVSHGFREVMGVTSTSQSASQWNHPPGWHLDSDNRWHLGTTDQYSASGPDLAQSQNSTLNQTLNQSLNQSQPWGQTLNQSQNQPWSPS